MSDAVKLELNGSVAWLTLNNPDKHNALSGPVLDGLHRAVAQLAVARSVRCAVIHGGEARAFSAGADLKERREMDAPAVFATVHRLREAVSSVERLPMPVIAAIHGSCFGGGLELALACDIRIASDDARLGLTEVAVGVLPAAGGTQRLPRLIGVGRAKELIYTAARLTAAEAAEIGLVNRVVPREELLPAAAAMAGRIAEMAPLCVQGAKRAMNAGQGLADGLQAEWEAYQDIILTQDRLEGLAAFSEKRKPVYRGE